MPTILVVDDDPEIRSTLKKLLELSGHSIFTASSGVEAQQCLAKEDVDLMITDIVMPDQDGLENMKASKLLKPDLPIVAMSGGGRLKTENYLRLAKAFGATAVLEKPFDTATLLHTIQQALQRPSESSD
ncbi:MAG: response regulator [Planctomycetes bacterium]|nr:response regulator [Planctomycetota bacterium]